MLRGGEAFANPGLRAAVLSEIDDIQNKQLFGGQPVLSGVFRIDGILFVPQPAVVVYVDIDALFAHRRR